MKPRIRYGLFSIAAATATLGVYLSGTHRTKPPQPNAPVAQSNSVELRAAIADKTEGQGKETLNPPLTTQPVNTPLPSGVRSAKTYPPESLPSPSIPLARVYDQLYADAQAGNYRASCRLSEELMRCGWLRKALTDERDTALSQIKRLTPDEAARKTTLENSITSLTTTLNETAAHCEGFVDKHRIPPWQHLYNAAASGHIPSMRVFATSPPMNPAEFAKDLEGWAVYRNSAPIFLQQAADAGDEKALAYLGSALTGNLLFKQPDHPGGADLSEVDYARAAKYLYARRLILGSPVVRNSPHLNKLEQTLTPAQITQAKREAEAILATWQATKPPTPTSDADFCSQ